LATRIIPIGKDNLTVESINGGLDYIEDVNAKAIYGIIEQIVEYKDIDDATVLKQKAQTDLPQYTQPKISMGISALDLSTLTNVSAERFTIGANIHIKNPIMNIDSDFQIVQIDGDLLLPWNPKLTIANFPLLLSNQIIDLMQTSTIVDKITTSDDTINTFWLDGIINTLQNQLKASAAYNTAQVVEDKGLLFENTNTSSPDYGALYMGPGMMAIANTKNPDGSWNWRTFGTGNGFTADEIKAGTLIGIIIKSIASNGQLAIKLADYQLKFYDFNSENLKGDIFGNPSGLSIYGVGQVNIGTATFDANEQIQTNSSGFTVMSDLL
jgi:hypothetical protein